MIESPEWRAMLDEIIAAPYDDLPRLVAADWLEETAGMVPCGKCRLIDGVHCVYVSFGPDSHWERCPTCNGSGEVSDGNRERAEFIRCQIKHWREPNDSAAAQFKARDLLGQYAGRWAPETTGRDVSWSRGFVSEIRLTLGQFVGGGECARCHGIGAVATPHWHSGCKLCHGTGRTPGCVGSLFGSHPITRVVLTDREPAEDSNGGFRWARQLPGYDLLRHDLPNEIFDAFSRSGSGYAWFYDKISALDWASARLVAYGRSLAFPVAEPDFTAPPNNRPAPAMIDGYAS